MRKIYVVTDSQPGCLPESEPMVYDRKSEALDGMREIRDGYLDQNGDMDREDQFIVLGQVRSGLIEITRRGRSDLGRVIECVEYPEKEARAMGLIDTAFDREMEMSHEEMTYTI